MAKLANLNPLHVSFLFLPLIFSCYLYPCLADQKASPILCESHSNIKGMFVFGSSVVDNGNNNYINGSLAKVNYLPYGIDFPLGPTGRFSNGKNVADTFACVLKLPLVPPFADPGTNGVKILHGVNYGSGGSGILDNTGSITGGVISLNEQIKNFEEVTLAELQKVLGHKANIGQYLFLIAAGSNDFGLNYFLQDNSTRPSLPVFVANLTSTYATQIQRLYKVGARKFVLLSISPIGCTPASKQMANSKGCVDTLNAAVKYFNTQLITMVDALNQTLPASNFIVVSTYNIIMDIINNPSATGFRNVTGPCCELKEILGFRISCKEGGKVCGNRDSYVYFDGQHNTESVNAIIAHNAFFSHSSSQVYPFNLQTLARL